MWRFAWSPTLRSANSAARELQPTTHTNLKLFGNRVAAVGSTRSVEEAVDVQNTADTFSPPDQPPINDTTIYGSQQVNIRVRFAEVSRDDVQRLGIGSSGGSIEFGGSGGEVDALVGALQRNGMLTILAEPNLTAVTGRPASFLAGGEIPIPTPGNQAGQITVQYKPFGVSLEFTPTLIRTNRIALRVRPEVSSLSRVGAVKANGVDLPSLMVRRADTTVEVASGQTFAIAGLFQRQMSLDYENTPEIADLPILGALFRSARYRRDETELVILITPLLVKPVRDRSLATPLDRPAPPPPPGRLSSKLSRHPSQIPALCSNDPRVHDAAYVRRLPLSRCSGVGPRRLCPPALSDGLLGHLSGAAAGLFAGLCLRARGRPEWPHTLCARPESLPCTGPDRASAPGTAFATGLRQRTQPSAHGRAPV